ncbi:MAG: hypothetical protein ABI321_00280 [Polyangia bacterium]
MRLTLVVFLLVTSCVHPLPLAPLRDPVSVARASRLVEPNLEGACRRYQAGRRDRRTVLACGKWMFFYESFGTSGVPSSLPRFLVSAFPAEVGAGFSELGMIPDPASHNLLPFGMAPGKMIGVATSIAYTCASCHVAKLPDGRISIGAPNHRYEYGKQILQMTMFPFVATGGEKGHDELALHEIRPLLDRLKAQPQIWAQLGGALMLAMGALKIPKLEPDVEHMYATWPAGTQDFVLAPLPTDDKVEIVGKIPTLFNLPREGEIERHHMVNAMYGWSGNAQSLVSFMHGFIAIGGGKPEEWPEERLHPLLEYLYSLRAPKNPSPPPRAEVAIGKALFSDKKCIECHDGPRHSGKRLYKFAEVGTDDALAEWLDPEKTGVPCCGVHIADPLTREVKSPRLDALWLQHRFLHNGALSSLEQLFCLEPRPVRKKPLGGEGHRQTCDGLSVPEKHALIAYLESL